MDKKILLNFNDLKEITLMIRFIIFSVFIFLGINLFSQNAVLFISDNPTYSFGQNESENFDYHVVEEGVKINFLEMEMPGTVPMNGFWDFFFSAKDRKGFGGVLLMVSSGVLASVALGENGGKQNNFLLGAVALGATGLYLYNSHLNENKVPRRKNEKKKYKASDWEIAEE